ncbi:MAG: GNAT family N-acetyltransferase [Bacteroidota bacterium]
MKTVIDLSDKNKSTLGLIPRQGFVEQAKKRQILIAHCEEELCGYILFRENKRNQVVVITQLCVDSKYRGKGIADRLLGELKEGYKHIYRGIILTCREDYEEAKELWRRNGFKPRTRKPSRSIKREHFLVKWFFSFGRTDLFDQENLEEGSEKIKAVLDANILISWSNQEQIGEPSKIIEPILSDWLSEHVSFYYPSEFHNEIYRDVDIKRRIFTQEFIRKINVQEVKYNHNILERVKNEVKVIFNPITDNDYSDVTCISEAIAANFKYFITNDEGIIRQGVIIEEKYNLKILSPHMFVLLVDKTVNDSDYSTQDLSGLNFYSKRVDNEDIEIITKRFLNAGEKEKVFRNVIKDILSNPRLAEMFVIYSEDFYAAIWAITKKPNCYEINLLRVNSNKLEREIFQQVITNIIIGALKAQCSVIKIRDFHFDETAQVHLLSFGFKKIGEYWHKVAIKGITKFENLYHTHKHLAEYEHIDEFVQAINDSIDIERKKRLLIGLERLLWPIKFNEIDMPVFIIPIKPFWASQLFDYEAAKQKLFKSDPMIAWKRDNIYYRSFVPNVEEAPARILWYASVEKGSSRQKSIVATSYLDGVSVDVAKSLFKQYEKYGVYKWTDISKLVKKDPNKKIKALKFSDTEVFEKPVPYKEIKALLTKLNYSDNNFVSPMKVGMDIFVELYLRGTP